MNIKNAGIRRLAQSVLLVAAAIVTGCASETPLDPSRSSTVHVQTGGGGGAADTGYAINMMTDVSLKHDDRGVDLGSCDSLKVERGNKLATRMFARGVQIYRWSGTAWVFVAPSAKLYPNAHAHGVIGTHYAGPTWETNNGNKVVGAVAKKCPADPKSIPWLLLNVVSVEGSGLFRNATFIQRINTVGGNAPAAAGTVIGQEANIPYTAEYLFYRAK
jgi:hypothetical protein